MKLSIITVCKNDVAGLKETIPSVLGQVFTDFEYFIIDGGSTDGSRELIKQYSTEITGWVSEPDRGIYEAMNKGISKATGEYCLFLNSGDCLASPEVLSIIFGTNLSTDIIYGDMLLKKKNSQLVYMKSPLKVTKRKMLTDTLWHPVSFIRRSLFEKYGMYDEKYRIAGDYEFFTRVLIGKKVASGHVNVAVSVFDENGLSSDMRNRALLLSERKEIQNKYFNPLLLIAYRLYSKFRN